MFPLFCANMNQAANLTLKHKLIRIKTQFLLRNIKLQHKNFGRILDNSRFKNFSEVSDLKVNQIRKLSALSEFHCSKHSRLGFLIVPHFLLVFYLWPRFYWGSSNNHESRSLGDGGRREQCNSPRILGVDVSLSFRTICGGKNA